MNVNPNLPLSCTFNTQLFTNPVTPEAPEAIAIYYNNIEDIYFIIPNIRTQACYDISLAENSPFITSPCHYDEIFKPYHTLNKTGFWIKTNSLTFISNQLTISELTNILQQNIS